MSGVNGIGGVFVYASDPHALAAWYAEHFGLVFLSSEEERAKGTYRYHSSDSSPTASR